MAKKQHFGSRRALARLNKIAWLILHRKAVNAPFLANEVGCSTKTIFRDLDFLRDELQHDIDYDPRTYSFFYRTQPLSLSDPRRRLLV